MVEGIGPDSARCGLGGSAKLVAMRLILASSSPRRAQLLRDAGYAFEQAAPTWADPATPPPGDAEHVAMATADRKARSVRREAIAGEDDVVVIGADTLIVCPDGVSLAGTPQTPAEARTMIRSFLNADHDVVTGVALWTPLRGRGGPTCFADRARVRMGAVPDAALETYLASGAWRGKAGGYNLFERRDAGWPIEVRGDESTVVGLPMAMLAVMLNAIQTR